MQHTKRLGLTLGDSKLLLAVSGGLDSMVLVHLFHNGGFNFAVAHVNFQLRGADSDGDEQFVKDWCHQYKIPFYSTRFETNNYATAHKVSIQMAARDLRYSWFEGILKTEGYQVVATAHHINDSLETVLINLARGCGLEGMAGIPLKSENRIRPLLFASRGEIENYAAQNGIAWREDSSNLTDDYQRNFIRHQVVPLLKKINPSMEETFRETTTKIQSELALLQNDMEEWKALHVSQQREIVRINKQGFVPETGASRLWHCIKTYGFSYSQCEHIMRGLLGQSGKQFMSTTHKLVIDRDFLVVTVENKVLNEVMILQNQESVMLGSREMRIIPEHVVEPSSNQNIALLDADKFTFPLIWRTWRAGDFFYPLGMSHRKKISDFLVDSKISRGEKDFVTVLESSGEIVWVVGHRIDNRFKLTPETRNVLSFFIQPYL